MKSVLRDIIKKPVQSSIMLVVLLVVLTFEMVGASIYSSASEHETDVQNKLGASLEIYRSGDYWLELFEKFKEEYGSFEAAKDAIDKIDDITIDEKYIKQISNIEHVSGVNVTSGYFAVPDGFENIKEYTTEGNFDLTKQEVLDENIGVNKNNVTLNGNMDSQYAEEFLKGYATLIEGDFPGNNKKGALIEKKLSEKNNLSIGDTITVHSPMDNSITVALEIIGIYETKEFFEVTRYNEYGEDVLAYHPSNRIYCDFDDGFAVRDEEKSIEDIEIYVDNVKNMDNVAKNILTLDLDWEKLCLENATETKTAEVSSMLSSIMDSAKIIIIISLLFGSIILALIVSFWSKSEIREFGIYMALGEKKTHIILRKCAYILIILIIALGLSALITVGIDYLLTGRYVINYSESMSNGEYTTVTYYSFKTVIEEPDEVVNIALNISNFLLCTLSGIFFSLVAIAGSVINILRKKTNEILRKDAA